MYQNTRKGPGGEIVYFIRQCNLRNCTDAQRPYLYSPQRLYLDVCATPCIKSK